MTRTYALKRLLEHGALTFHEIIEITGWKKSQAKETLKAMKESGMVEPKRKKGNTRFSYKLYEKNCRTFA